MGHALPLPQYHQRACRALAGVPSVPKSGQTLCNQALERVKISDMVAKLFGFAILLLAVATWAQTSSDKKSSDSPPANAQESKPTFAPPRSDRVRADDLGNRCWAEFK